MKGNSFIYNIHRLVAKDAMETAIDHVIDVCTSNKLVYLYKAIIISMELTSLKTNFRNGLISLEDRRIEKRKLAMRLLELVAFIGHRLDISNQN